VDWFDFHPRGSWSTGLAGNLNYRCRDFPSRSAPAWNHARRPHHVDYAGDEAEQKKHDETERRCRQQTVETPANHRPDDNARDQLRGEAETARHGRSSGSTVSAFGAGLISPDLAVVANFGQPMIQTSEPCGKRSFVGGRLIAMSICIVVGVFGHAQDIKRCCT
jgi:hypothetical protein